MQKNLSADINISNQTSRMQNQTVSTLTNKFDTACLELKDVFLTSAQSEKLNFYFKKTFMRVPKVVMSYRSISLNSRPLNSTANGGSGQDYMINIGFSISESNVNLQGFRYSISQLSKQTWVNQMLNIKAIMVCYIAFEEVKPTTL